MEYYDPMEMKCPWCRRPDKWGYEDQMPNGDYETRPPQWCPWCVHPDKWGVRPCQRCIRTFDMENRSNMDAAPGMGQEQSRDLSENFPNVPEDETEEWDNNWMRPEFGKEYEGTLPMDLLQMPSENINYDEEDPMPAGTEDTEIMAGMEEEKAEFPENMEETSFQYYEDDYEAERDFARLKDLYPEAAKELMPLVEEECDKLEYEGSLMFDEYPDRTMVSEITGRIYDQVKDKYNIQEGEDKDEMLAMNVETYRRYPPKKNWLRDLAKVLFVDEIFRRRHRKRKHRR